MVLTEMGSRSSNIARSAEFLKAQTRRIEGISVFCLDPWKRISLIMEIKGAMPLPPLTITSESCLKSVTNACKNHHNWQFKQTKESVAAL